MVSPFQNVTSSVALFGTAHNAETLDVTSADHTWTGNQVCPRALSIGNTGTAGVAVAVRPLGGTADVSYVCAGGAETYIPLVVTAVRQNASTALQIKALY